MRLHHLAFRCDDVDRLVAFYQEWLGLAIVRDTRPRSVWLAIGTDAVLMLEAREPSEPRVAAGALDLAAFHVDSETRMGLRVRLVEAGLLEAETAHTLYFRDPEGRRLGVSSFPLGQVID